MSRFAGQVGDISQFLPQDGLNPSEIIGTVMNANSMKKNSGLLAQVNANKAMLGTAGLVQEAHQKGRMTKAKADLDVTKILTQGKMQTSKQDAQGESNLWSGITQMAGGFLSGGLGAIGSGGGGGNMGGSNYWDPITGKGVAGPNWGL